MAEPADLSRNETRSSPQGGNPSGQPSSGFASSSFVPFPGLLPQSSQATSRLAALQAQLLLQHAQLWSAMLGRNSGSPAPVIAEADAGDRRFLAAAWRDDPFHDYLRQSYLINTRFTLASIDALDMDAATRERLQFATRQLIDALSPANFAATNPEVIQLALESQGESIAQGIRNLVEDTNKGHISTTDESKFEVGRNLAITPGAVVFENELIQLIQYAPATEQVFEIPLVMVPPCINKFYILDLRPENSFVRHAVSRGQTVFMVSWKNVLDDQQALTWEDYLQHGVIKALDTARRIGKSEMVNALGFCVGGTMLSAALSVLEAKGQRWVESLTLLASLLDFSSTGEIGVFIDDASVAMREATIGGPAGGIMPGRDLAMVFSALRANDLIWSYVVNNYLKGRQPAAFDILYWNGDSTNLPGPMYCWYVRNMYLDNSLGVPGRLRMLGEAVDLGRLRMPAYVLATREDHIVPWAAAYRSMHLLGGDIRFVLGASGHVAGVVNPAEANRRSYWVNAERPTDAQQWLDGAIEQPGSWWGDWSGWLEQRSGKRVKAKKRLGGNGFRPIEPAPGRYVLRRVV